jgi:hypothetical protein
MQMGQKSPGRAHGDWSTSNRVILRKQKVLETQRSRTDVWEQTVMHLYAEDKVTTVEVGMWHITEVHSHHHHHIVDTSEWKF